MTSDIKDILLVCAQEGPLTLSETLETLAQVSMMGMIGFVMMISGLVRMTMKLAMMIRQAGA